MRAPLLCIALLALAACGGDGGGDRLSKEEFARQGNALCADYEGKLNALSEPQTTEEFAAFAKEARAALDEGLEDLGGLEPPEDLEAKYEQWLATGDEASDRIGQLQQAAEQGDQAEIQRIFQEASDEEMASDRLARELGLTECAND